VSTLIVQQLHDAASDLDSLTTDIHERVEAGHLPRHVEQKISRAYDRLERHQWLFDLKDFRGYHDRLNFALKSYQEAYDELHGLLHPRREIAA
jgi:hypothetical protein